MSMKQNEQIQSNEENKCLVNFSLSASGLKRINSENYENNFKIIFQNGKLLRVPDFLAEFLTFIISKMKAENPKVNELRVDADVTQDAMRQLEMLLHGQSISITDLKDFFVNMSIKSENPEPIEKLPFEIITKI